ncbi:MAG: hypothetical protein WBV82_22015 [Myxococcaceae bacterium]
MRRLISMCVVVSVVAAPIFACGQKRSYGMVEANAEAERVEALVRAVEFEPVTVYGEPDVLVEARAQTLPLE